MSKASSLLLHFAEVGKQPDRFGIFSPSLVIQLTLNTLLQEILFLVGYELFPNALVPGEKPCSRLFAFTSFHLASRYEERFNFQRVVYTLAKVLIPSLLSYSSVF